MIKWTLALLLIACQQLVFSQTQEIDSLLQKLSAARPDTNKGDRAQKTGSNGR